MTKQIFTKTQAVGLLVQLKDRPGQEIDIYYPVDAKHNLFKYSCDELEKKLLEHVREEGFAGVVDDPVPTVVA